MTAELVMALPILVVVTGALAWLLALGADQVRMVDAAREVARAMARGDDRDSAVAAGARVAPEGTRFTVQEEQGLLIVRARHRAVETGVLSGLLPEVTLAAEAVALAEEEG